MVDEQQSTAHKEQRDRQEQQLTAQATINKSTAAETGQPTRQQQQRHNNQQDNSSSNTTINKARQ